MRRPTNIRCHHMIYAVAVLLSGTYLYPAMFKMHSGKSLRSQLDTLSVEREVHDDNQHVPVNSEDRHRRMPSSTAPFSRWPIADARRATVGSDASDALHVSVTDKTLKFSKLFFDEWLTEEVLEDESVTRDKHWSTLLQYVSVAEGGTCTAKECSITLPLEHEPSPASLLTRRTREANLLVLTSATYDSIDYVLSFCLTLQRVTAHSVGKTYLYIHTFAEADSLFVRQAQRYCGASVITNEDLHMESKGNQQWSRHLFLEATYKKALQDHPAIDLVLNLDVADTAFQADPRVLLLRSSAWNKYVLSKPEPAWVRRSWRDEDVPVVFFPATEHVNLGGNFNGEWLNSCLGKNWPDIIDNDHIITCSGTLIGTPKGLSLFFHTFSLFSHTYKQSKRFRDYCHDQTALIVIFYSWMIHRSRCIHLPTIKGASYANTCLDSDGEHMKWMHTLRIVPLRSDGSDGVATLHTHWRLPKWYFKRFAAWPDRYTWESNIVHHSIHVRQRIIDIPYPSFCIDKVNMMRSDERDLRAWNKYSRVAVAHQLDRFFPLVNMIRTWTCGAFVRWFPNDTLPDGLCNPRVEMVKRIPYKFYNATSGMLVSNWEEIQRNSSN